MGPNKGELVRSDDGQFFIVMGEPGAYELYRCSLHHERSFKRKWEALAAATGKDSA